MRDEIIYLDSSAIIKRYIKEPGSSEVKRIYLKAYSGDTVVSYSIWNIGEVLGALDRAHLTKRIDRESYNIVRRRFMLDVKRLVKLGSLLLIPMHNELLVDGWGLIEKHHIYEADAIQIVSAKYSKAGRFLTGDKHLHKVALSEGINSELLE